MSPEEIPEGSWIELRRELHRAAELSGEEEGTASRVAAEVGRLRPDRLVRGIGGHGVAAVWGWGAPGPNVLLRSELDALPIADVPGLPHASRTPGVGHHCGHDGHMATMLAAVSRLVARPPVAGGLTLLFQPAEETGEGAARVLADSAFPAPSPDFAIAFHNLPGFPLGSVVVRDDVFACGSLGADIRLTGAESHAAEPDRGRSPVEAVAAAILELKQLNSRTRDAAHGAVTVTHVNVGAPAFGTSPGSARILATLRSANDAELSELAGGVESLVRTVAGRWELESEIAWREPFPVTRVDSALAERIADCARREGREVHRPADPFLWSEDFGHFTSRVRGALFGLGAGERHASLHHPDYDYPDELIGIGADLVAGLVRSIAADPPGSEGTP